MGYLTEAEILQIRNLMAAAVQVVASGIPGEMRGIGDEVYLVDRASFISLYQVVVGVPVCSDPLCEKCQRRRQELEHISLGEKKNVN